MRVVCSVLYIDGRISVTDQNWVSVVPHLYLCLSACPASHRIDVLKTAKLSFNKSKELDSCNIQTRTVGLLGFVLDADFDDDEVDEFVASMCVGNVEC